MPQSRGRLTWTKSCVGSVVAVPLRPREALMRVGVLLPAGMKGPAVETCKGRRHTCVVWHGSTAASKAPGDAAGQRQEQRQQDGSKSDDEGSDNQSISRQSTSNHFKSTNKHRPINQATVTALAAWQMQQLHKCGTDAGTGLPCQG